MKVKEFDFGAPAAERDQALHDYFVESEIFAATEKGKKNILIGPRGSGKSAVFKILGEREKKRGSGVFEIRPDNYSYEILKDVLAQELQGNWAKQGAYTASWKHVLYITAMKTILRVHPDASAKSFKKIQTFLRDNYQNQQDDVLDNLISYMKRLERIKFGQYEGGLKARELQKLYKLEEIEEHLEDLCRLLDKKRIVLLIDELDSGWDASEDARQFVAGVFQAAIQVSSIHPNLRALVSLRRELYDNIPEIYEDAQKFRDLVGYLSWDEETLKKVMAQRIAKNVEGGASMTVEDAWTNVFQETLEYRKSNSFNYIVDRTLYRPREIIQFCTECVAAADADSGFVDYGIIARAEAAYSRDRVQDIDAEYRFQYPGLSDVFETFRGMVYSFTRTELEEHCINLIAGEVPVKSAWDWVQSCDERSLVRILWEVGFLKALAVGGQKATVRSGSRYVGSYQLSTLNLDSVQQFQVHPMFRSYLGLKEK